MKEEKTRLWGVYLLLSFIILVLVCNSLIMLVMFAEDLDEGLVSIPYDEMEGDRIAAIVPIYGDLLAPSDVYSEGVDADETMTLLMKAGDQENVDGIILLIDSYGGSMIAAQRLGELLEEANKTSVAAILESGNSAAYALASYADHIIATKYSDVGSIGVIIEYEYYNTTHEVIKAGKYKDIFSSYRPMTPEERVIVEKDLEIFHQEFVRDISVRRSIPIEELMPIADGRSYNAKQALLLGLIDGIGGQKEALEYISLGKDTEVSARYYNFESGRFDLAYPLGETFDEEE